jgi:hypothetical protein
MVGDLLISLGWQLVSILAKLVPAIGSRIAENYRYGIQIVSPAPGSKFPEGWVTVTGVYRVPPPADSVYLIVSWGEEGLHWPQRPVVLDRDRRTWSGQVFLGGGPPRGHIITVALVGKSGKVLFRYFRLTGEYDGTNAHWHPIRTMTDDVIACDRVTVVNSS